jgi:predicted nucleic acid-binding protein
VNASPLIVLARAGRIDLLRVLGDQLVVPVAVGEEVRAHSDEAARVLNAEASWLVEVAPAVIPDAIAVRDLGPGESAVRRMGIRASWFDRDRRRLRCTEMCRGHQVRVMGTVGLTRRAKMRGYVPAARPVIEELRRAGLYLSDAVMAEALSIVDE